jgi:hypothetical protein
VKGVAKETGNEALSSSLGAVSSIILVHGVLERYIIRISAKTPVISTKAFCGFIQFSQLNMGNIASVICRTFP